MAHFVFQGRANMSEAWQSSAGLLTHESVRGAPKMAERVSCGFAWKTTKKSGTLKNHTNFTRMNMDERRLSGLQEGSLLHGTM